jgi:membrane-bound lytic murein transglycosylase B
MKKIFLLLALNISLFALDTSRYNIKEFINKMYTKYGFSKTYLEDVLKSANFSDYALSRYDGRVKNATDYSWRRYKSKILIPESIELGKEFMQKYDYWLTLASKRYKVDKEIITAFIRVESKFGLYGSEFRVIDVLSTLAFYKNRKQKFFKRELEKLFIMARKAHVDIKKLRGSFAGAMGYVQQMPSIYLRYAVDLDKDGKKNPNSMPDAIGSIAKFLHNNGWKNYRVTVMRAKARGSSYLNLRSSYKSRYSLKTLKKYGIYPLGEWRDSYAYYIRLYNGKGYDLYLGDKNYRIITFYNHSKQYALSIALYAKALKH